MKNILLTIMLTVLCACQLKQPQDAERVDAMPPIYPDYIGVTIPSDIAPMNFNVEAEGTDAVFVAVQGSQGGRLETAGEWADFDLDEWRELTEMNRGGELTFSVWARKDGRWLQYNDFVMHVSENDLDEWGVTYRRIKPGYEVGGDIGIFQRSLSTFDEYAIVTETALPGKCFNCHTVNRTDPKQVTLQVRGEGGGTLVTLDGKQNWLNTKTATTRAAGSYSYWHPDGDYVVTTASAVHQCFFTGTRQRIEVFHSFSDIEVLDTRTNELILTPLLRTDDLEIFPAFSHDGRWIYYSTSKYCNLPAEYEKVKCSICRIGFDAATGQFGQEVDTLVNARFTDRSYVIARPSYDGRWLMYNVASRGNFPVSQDDADLCIMNLATGEQRVMTELNSPRTESYHNWSRNSKWVVFSSKRENGMYTQLFFAEIGDDGHATKPFVMPQRNPRKFYFELMDAYNCPDFTHEKVQLSAHEMQRRLEAETLPGVTIRTSQNTTNQIEK